MRITAARVIVCSPGRNFVTLQITTSDGVTGLGDATLNGRELAVAAYLSEHVAPALIGRDPARIEDTWQYLYKGAYWRRGPVTMSAIGAVDTALWDIKGKVAGLPVYQLLGGRSRSGVLAYAHAYGADVPAVLSSVAASLSAGYRAVRVQVAVPGISDIYGVSSSSVYEPAAAAPAEGVWSTRRYLAFLPSVFAAVRAEFGPDLRLLHDAHHRLSPLEAAQLGKALEPYDLTWLEDPTPAEMPSAYRLIRSHTTTPLAVGEVFNSIWDCEELLRDRSIDYLRASVSHAGGLTHLRRIFDLAALHQVRSGSHGATDLSPVCLAAALHLDLAIPNFGLQEHMPHTTETDEVFPHGYRYDNEGYLHPAEEPGLGVSIDEAAAARFPYRPASLPVNRLEDGTLHDW
ncbi:MAG: D-mannonate dehydratase ManD [Actinoplanes sp.]